MRQYYKGFSFCQNEINKFEEISSVSILKILTESKMNKATGMDNLRGRFLKDGSNTLCTPIAKITIFT